MNEDQREIVKGIIGNLKSIQNSVKSSMQKHPVQNLNNINLANFYLHETRKIAGDYTDVPKLFESVSRKVNEETASRSVHGKGLIMPVELSINMDCINDGVAQEFKSILKRHDMFAHYSIVANDKGLEIAYVSPVSLWDASFIVKYYEFNLENLLNGALDK